MNDLSICFEFMDYPQTNKELWQQFMIDYTNNRMSTIEEYLLNRYNAHLITRTMSIGQTYCYRSAIIRFISEEYKTEFLMRYL